MSGGAVVAVVFVFFAFFAAVGVGLKFCKTPNQRQTARQAAARHLATGKATTARHLATGKAALHKLTAHGALEATPQAPQSQWTSNPTADIECAQAQAEPTGQAAEASDAEQPAPAVAKAAAMIQPGAPPTQQGPASDFVAAALLPVGMFAASAICSFLSGSALTTGCLENDLGIEIGGVELGDLDVPGADAWDGEACPVTGFLFADLNIGNDIKDGRVYAGPNYFSTGFGAVSVLCGLFILFGSKRDTKGAGQCAGILAFIAALVGAILTRINRQQYWAAFVEDNAAAQAINMVAEASGSDETLCDVFEFPFPFPDGVRPCALADKAQVLSCAAAVCALIGCIGWCRIPKRF